MEGIGRRIREIRIKRGLSQEALAKQVGVAQSAISQIEREQITPSTRLLWRISRALDVSIDMLMQEVEAEEAPHA